MTDSFDAPGDINLNISGKVVWIADTSGLPIETQQWSGQRFVKVWISGQHVDTNVTVQVSGVTATISVSGNPVMVSGESVRISGQVVYLASGQNAVQNSGQVVYLASGFNEIAGSFTANVSGQPVRISGDTVIALISGQTVVANVVTNISGQTVYLASGNNAVQMSGQTVVVPSTSVSGNVVVVPSTSISGNAVRISGETVQIAGGINVSGSPVRISGETIYPVSGLAFNKVFDPSGVTWNDWWVDASGSNRALVAISGQTVLASVSGNVVKISGETVQIAGGVSVSGNMVSISGQPVAISGSMVSISGQPVSVSGNAVRISGETVQIAGGINVSGSPVRVSGETVYLVSGQNAVQMSGQTVVVPFTSVSGNMVSISGQPVSVSGNLLGTQVFGTGFLNNAEVSQPDDDTHANSSFSLETTSYLYATDNTTNAKRVRVTASGQGISGIAHKLVVTFSGDSIIGSVSGNMVSVSGQPVSVSGNAIGISGQAVLISGQTVVASVTTNISGQTVYTASGNNAVQNSGQTVYPVSGKGYTQIFDPSGNQWLDLWSAGSGNHNLAVSTQVTTNISGQVVYLVSGQNNVQMSGQSVNVTSGQVSIFDPASAGIAEIRATDGTFTSRDGLITIATLQGYDRTLSATQLVTVTASGQGISGIPHRLVVALSGDPVSVSGQAISVSGNAVRTSGEISYPVSGKSYMQAFDPSGVTWNDVWVGQSGGHAVQIAGSFSANVSGNVVYLTSGQNNVQISGQLVVVSGIVGANVSGNIVRTLPDGNTTIRTASGLVCTSLSGGTQLPSLACDRLTIRMTPDHSGRMYVGSTTNPPFSGMGFILAPGDGITLQTTNANIFQVFASRSGEQVFFIGEDT